MYIGASGYLFMCVCRSDRCHVDSPFQDFQPFTFIKNLMGIRSKGVFMGTFNTCSIFHISVMFGIFCFYCTCSHLYIKFIFSYLCNYSALGVPSLNILWCMRGHWALHSAHHSDSLREGLSAQWCCCHVLSESPSHLWMTAVFSGLVFTAKSAPPSSRC